MTEHQEQRFQASTDPLGPTCARECGSYATTRYATSEWLCDDHAREWLEKEHDRLRGALHRLCADVLTFGGAELLEPGGEDNYCPIHTAQTALGCEGWCQPDSHRREADKLEYAAHA